MPYSKDYSEARPHLEAEDIVTVWVSRDGTYAQLHFRDDDMSLRQVPILPDRSQPGIVRVKTDGLLLDWAWGASWLEAALRFAKGRCLIGRVTVKAHQDESYDQHEYV